jgi:hypothetical protein
MSDGGVKLTATSPPSSQTTYERNDLAQHIQKSSITSHIIPLPEILVFFEYPK